MKHTPGPWRWRCSLVTGQYYVQRGDEGGFVVQGLTHDRAKADARLIAKAPEMYDLLKTLSADGGTIQGEDIINLLKEIDQ